jgi:hypothetical protein
MPTRSIKECAEITRFDHFQFKICTLEGNLSRLNYENLLENPLLKFSGRNQVHLCSWVGIRKTYAECVFFSMNLHRKCYFLIFWGITRFCLSVLLLRHTLSGIDRTKLFWSNSTHTFCKLLWLGTHFLDALKISGLKEESVKLLQ